MLVYRICRTKYAQQLVASGIAGRWNTEGQKVIYTAGSASLACLEVLANLSGAILQDLDFSIVTISIPTILKTEEIDTNKLQHVKSNWHALENYHVTQKLGNEWLSANKTAVLKVPSAIIDIENNYLINPMHPDFWNIKLVNISAFSFDSRLRTTS